MKLTFERNWTHLAIRHAYNDAGILDDDAKQNFPLNDNFKKWAAKNWDAIGRKLDLDPIIGVTHKPFSELDYLNLQLRDDFKRTFTGICNRKWIINRDKKLTAVPIEECEFAIVEHIPNKYLVDIFPVSKELEIHIRFDPVKEKKRIDECIRKWNPRVTYIDELLDTDEYGNPLDQAEYCEIPELIGVDTANTQLIGIDEYENPVFSEFDEDGVFMPMGNPENSTDTRDDEDMTDRETYQSQAWESIDLVDDHNVDMYFRQECVTETPTFDKDGELVDWSTVNHSDQADPVAPADNEDWLEDAKNWLTRENMLREQDDEDIQANIIAAYPVSPSFLDYLDENEIDWEVANSRLQELTGEKRKLERPEYEHGYIEFV